MIGGIAAYFGKQLPVHICSLIYLHIGHTAHIDTQKEHLVKCLADFFHKLVQCKSLPVGILFRETAPGFFYIYNAGACIYKNRI